jgi:hypothetical protein
MATNVAIGLQPLLLVSHALQLIHAMSVRLAIRARQLVVVSNQTRDQHAPHDLNQTHVQRAIHAIAAIHDLQPAAVLKATTAQSVLSTAIHDRLDHSKTVDLTVAIA